MSDDYVTFLYIVCHVSSCVIATLIMCHYVCIIRTLVCGIAVMCNIQYLHKPVLLFVYQKIHVPYTAKLSRGKLSRLFTKHTIHWKTFAMHQVHAIMYCTRQVIQGENFCDWLKNHKKVLLYAVYKKYCVYDVQIDCSIRVFRSFANFCVLISL